jgi:predicted glutamate--cysteine ligase
VRSNPANPYHAFIETTYGTRVVTASVHLNLGMSAMEALFAGLRLLRCEAALLLALSASSPFLDGHPTGVHSQRWLQFPLTPPQVPLFLDHGHYIRWVGEQLDVGAMRNVRHLWTSVRPNGEDRPYRLNRLEVRICDLISDPLLLLAITAFAELRLQRLLQDPGQQDPLEASRLSPAELAGLADSNDQAASRASLEAELIHWRTGEPIRARDWIRQELEQMGALAADLDLSRTLAPLGQVLEEGNEAIRWLGALAEGESIRTILTGETAALKARETELEGWLTTDAPHPLG